MRYSHAKYVTVIKFDVCGIWSEQYETALFFLSNQFEKRFKWMEQEIKCVNFSVMKLFSEKISGREYVSDTYVGPSDCLYG